MKLFWVFFFVTRSFAMEMEECDLEEEANIALQETLLSLANSTVDSGTGALGQPSRSPQ